MIHSCVGRLVCLISCVTRMWFTLSPPVVEERRVPVACLETNTWEVTLVPAQFLVVSTMVLCLWLGSVLSRVCVLLWCECGCAMSRLLTSRPRSVAPNRGVFLYILTTWWTTLLVVLAPDMNFLVFVLIVCLMALDGSNEARTSMRGVGESECSRWAVLTLLMLGTVTLTSIILGPLLVVCSM